MTEKKKGCVVITGASTGIGKATALLLARTGYHVFAGVRSAEAEKILRQDAAGLITPIMLDITQKEQIAAAAKTVSDTLSPNQGLAGLINNAGIVIAGPLEFVPIEKIRAQFEVNVLGHIAVTQAFLPLIRKNRGRILNIGTAGWRFTPPFLGPYIASKFAIEAITHIFRRELQPWGISVSVIEPGSIETPIWDKSLKVADTLEADFPAKAHALYGRMFANGRKILNRLRLKGLHPEAAAKVICHALETNRPKLRYFVGIHACIGSFLTTITPCRIVDRISSALLSR